MTGSGKPRLRSAVLEAAWHRISGVEVLSAADGGPLTRTVKKIIDPLVVRTAARPKLGRPLLEPAAAAEVTDLLLADAPRLRATAAWFVHLKRQRRALRITAGNVQDVCFPLAYELATNFGMPGPEAPETAASALRELHGEGDEAGIAQLTAYLADPRAAADLTAGLHRRWHTDAGLAPSPLAKALAEYEPAALFLQPRAHNPTGASIPAARAAALATTLGEFPPVIVVEDDHAGDIASAPPVSIGSHLPDRTVHVSSFSKSHGPDLRLAAVGGPAALIDAVADRRLLGPGWSSRILQAVLLDLLTDPAAVAQVARARDEYARRRTRLASALSARGVSAIAADGINMWVPVDDQQVAMVALAGHGIAVAPGTPFEVSPVGGDHVRLTVGLVRDGFDELADILAQAAGLVSGGSGSRARPHPRGWR